MLGPTCLFSSLNLLITCGAVYSANTAELWARAPIHLTQCRSYSDLLIGHPILVFCNLTDLIRLTRCIVARLASAGTVLIPHTLE